MKCETEDCDKDCPEINQGRVCAYQVSYDHPEEDYKGAITCNCCDECRAECHVALLTEIDRLQATEGKQEGGGHE